MRTHFLQTNLFFKDKYILTHLIISGLLWLFSLLFLYFKIQPQAEPLALRYNIYIGVSLIGPWYYVFFIPLIGLLVILINFVLAYLFYLRIKLISYFTALAASLTQLLLAISAIIIYLLNF